MRLKSRWIIFTAVLIVRYALALPPPSITIPTGVQHIVTKLTSSVSHGFAVETLAHCHDGTVSCIPEQEHQYKKCIKGHWIVYECPWQENPTRSQYVCVPHGNKAQCHYKQMDTNIPTELSTTYSSTSNTSKVKDNTTGNEAVEVREFLEQNTKHQPSKTVTTFGTHIKVTTTHEKANDAKPQYLAKKPSSCRRRRPKNALHKTSNTKSSRTRAT
ncbi:hypothetical protein K7432_015644, partial [Basidiobolus ranarum]